jgi:predicted ArsR family transcriptional regulator
LAIVLLEEILEMAEPELAQQLFRRVSTRLGEQYTGHIPGEVLSERLEALVSRLHTHGILTQVDEAEDLFVLTEYGCPYFRVAQQHREVCEMEIEAMEQALGTEVTLCHSQLDGHHGCQFQVRK